MLTPFYHVGFIVPDVGEAQRGLSATLGLSWASRQQMPMRSLVEGKIVDATVRFVYSIEGPPYVELVELVEPAPWGRNSVGIHHYGVWSEDVIADMDDMVAQRGTVEATGVNRRNDPDYYAYVRGPTGLLVELVDKRAEAALNRWLAGGDYA